MTTPLIDDDYSEQLLSIRWDRIEHETDRAYLLLIGGEKIWLPKSQVEIEGHCVVMPRWLASERGIEEYEDDSPRLL